MLAYTTQGRDINLDISRVVGYKQFCNKLWNAVKFCLTYVSDFQPTKTMHVEVVASSAVSERDLFILSKLNTLITDCNLQIKEYNFGGATSSLYSFFLYDLCDFYLELVKPVMYEPDENNQRKYCARVTLYTVIEQYLRLLHPFMPFVTEELWQRLPNISMLADTASIMVAKYPVPIDCYANTEVEVMMELLQHTIHGGRSLRADYKVANNIKVDFYYKTEDEATIRTLSALQDDFNTLARGNFLKRIDDTTDSVGFCVKVLSDKLTLLVSLKGIIDVDVELTRLGKEKERIASSLDSYTRKLTAAGYEEKVPEAVRKANTSKIVALEVELQSLEAAIISFSLMKK